MDMPSNDLILVSYSFPLIVSSILIPLIWTVHSYFSILQELDCNTLYDLPMEVEKGASIYLYSWVNYLDQAIQDEKPGSFHNILSIPFITFFPCLPD